MIVYSCFHKTIRFTDTVVTNLCNGDVTTIPHGLGDLLAIVAFVTFSLGLVFGVLGFLRWILWGE